MIKHIVIAVDASGPSLHASRYGLSLARQAGAKVTLLSVLPPPTVVPVGPLSGYVPLSRPVGEEDVRRIRALFDEIAAENPGLEIAHAVELGPVVDTICDYAANHDADLIVVGARGHGVARRILLGSVSQQVIQHAHCPVLVWRSHEPMAVA